MSLQTDIIKLGNILENVDSDFKKELAKVEKSYLSLVLKVLRDFENKNGSIVKSRLSQKLTRQLTAELLEVIKKSNYATKVDEYLETFETVEDLTISTIQGVNGINIAKSTLSVEKSEAIKTVSNRLTSVSAIEANIIQPVKDVLFSAIRTGANIKATEEALRQLINPANQNSFLQRYAGQVSTDSVMQYQGNIQTVIAEQYELDAFRIVGSIIETTRDNCREMINGTGKFADLAQSAGVYLVSDIKEIIRRAAGRGGWNPATNESNYLTLRNGFRCRHRFIPFKIANEKAATQVAQIKIRTKKAA